MPTVERCRVIRQSADLFHSRADTSPERHSRKLPPLLLLLLLRFLLPPTESRQRQHPANIPSNRYESGLPNLRLVARKARRYNDFRRELCVATFQLFVSFLVSSFAYVEFVSVFTSETRLSSKFWIDRYNFSFLLNVFLHNEKKLYSFFNDS